MNFFMSVEEKEAYLKALMSIAMCDEAISEEEMSYFIKIGKSMGLTKSRVDHIFNDLILTSESIDSILAVIKSEKGKLELVEELISLCYVDGEYSIAEKLGIREICSLLGISENKLGELESKSEDYGRGLKVIRDKGEQYKEEVIKAFNLGKEKTAAIGKKVASGSAVIARAVSAGIVTAGSKIALTLENAKKLREENRSLRERLQKDTFTEAIKQKLILQLSSKISSLSSQLAEEKRRNERNEEMIALLQAQIDDLMLTLDVADKAKTG